MPKKEKNCKIIEKFIPLALISFLLNILGKKGFWLKNSQLKNPIGTREKNLSFLRSNILVTLINATQKEFRYLLLNSML